MGTELWRADVETIARAAVRDEIASLAGLVLRRVQELERQRASRDAVSSVSGAKIVYGASLNDLAHIFGELLRDYGGTDSAPGVDG